MDKTKLLHCLETMDNALSGPVTLCVYGSAAFILLDEPDRTSLDIDVAAPYSTAAFPQIVEAAKAAGLLVNPPEEQQGDHIEWIQSVRLCLAPPDPGSQIVLWQGKNLAVITVALADLVASKLIRYDEIDQADVAFLLDQGRVTLVDVKAAIKRLPSGFRDDPVVLDNMANLETDWKLRKDGGA